MKMFESDHLCVHPTPTNSFHITYNRNEMNTANQKSKETDTKGNITQGQAKLLQ